MSSSPSVPQALDPESGLPLPGDTFAPVDVSDLRVSTISPPRPPTGNVPPNIALQSAEQQNLGEAQYKNFLFQNKPEEFKQAYPAEYFGRKAHDFLSNAISEPVLRNIADENVRKQLEPQIRELADLGMSVYGVALPKGDPEPVIKGGAVVPEGGALEEELAASTTKAIDTSGLRIETIKPPAIEKPLTAPVKSGKSAGMAAPRAEPQPIDMSGLRTKQVKAAPERAKAEPNPEIAAGAQAYNKAAGRPEISHEPKPLDISFGQRVADAYENMKSEPTNPKVKASYDAMKQEVKAQWDYATKKMGVEFEPTTTDPYPGGSGEMMKDVRDNKHLFFFKTGADFPKDHPLAEVDKETGLTYNDMFRAVHDLFGHAAGGFEFGPKGEENAYLAHRQMFSSEAVPALTTETRGQNSWVNFGPHMRTPEGKLFQKGESGYKSATERPFAEQKAGLLPEEFHAGEPGKKSTSEKLVDKYGTTNDHLKAGFILSDGRMVPLPSGQEHETMLNSVLPTGKDVKDLSNRREDFIEQDKAVRTRFRTSRGGDELVFSVPSSGVSDEQLGQMKQAVGKMGRYGNVVMEVGDPILAAVRNTSKEFVRPSDIEQMLDEIDALPKRPAPQPEKEPEAGVVDLGDISNTWTAKASEMMDASPSGAIDPRTGKSDTKGAGVEIYPEARAAREPLAQKPTEADLQSFYEEHKEIFDKHPELRVGWDKTDKGWELNVGAAGTKPGATLVGKKLGQRAAFDIEAQKEIPTGGTGTKTKFKQYPLEQRLSELSGEHLKALPKSIRESEHLTDDEKYLLAGNKTALEDFKETRKQIASQKELTETMKAGEANRFWYERARTTVDSIWGENKFPAEDKDRFINLLAATSPQQDPALNSRTALGAYKRWLDAGRPSDPNKIYDLFLPKDLKNENPIMMSTHAPNAVRALTGQPLSGPKVTSFAVNLSGIDPAHVTNDMWGAITNGIIDAKELTKPGKYIALSERYRQAAKELGWTPQQGQAASWGFVRTLGYASGWKGTSKWTPPAEIVKLIDDPLVRKYSADIADIFLTNTEVRNRLESLGVDLNEFDKRLKTGIEQFPRGGEGKTRGANPALLAKTASKVESAKQAGKQAAAAGKRIGGKMQSLLEEDGAEELAAPRR